MFSILIVKSSTEVSAAMSVAVFKNTHYDSLAAPPVGPNIKPLKLNLEIVNDGMAIAMTQ